MASVRGERRGRVLIGAAALGVLAVTASSAYRAWGRPYASLLVDPYAEFSAVHLEDWGVGELQPLRALDPLIGVDGEPLSAPRNSRAAARELDRRLGEADSAGRDSLSISFATTSGPRSWVRPLRRIDLDLMWWFCGLYVLMGLNFLWSGYSVWRLARGRSGAAAYVAVAVCSFGLLVTFFDYHSLGWLAPLFGLSSGLLPAALIALALDFPHPFFPSPLGRTLRRILFAAAALVAVLLAAAPFLPIDLRPLRQLMNSAVLLSLFVLALSVAGRLIFSESHFRKRLRALIASFLILPLLLAAGAIGVSLGLSIPSFHVLLPFVGLVVPAAVGFAVIRDNVMDATEVVARRLLAVSIALIATAVAGTALFSTRHSFTGTGATSASLSVAVCAGLAFLLVADRGVESFVFSMRARYRPTVGQLADSLASLRTVPAIRERLRSLLAGAFDGSRTRLLSSEEARTLTSGPEDGTALMSGSRVWLERAHRRHLVVPMRSVGELIGAVVLERERSDPLLTVDDLAIIESVASLGALAIHNVEAIARLQDRHDLEAATSRGEKRMAVDVLAAEVAHEVAYPLNYFRHFLKRLASGHSPRAEDMEIGQEEINRLEQMLATLRRLQLKTPSLQPVSVRAVAERASVILQPELEQRGQRFALQVPPHLSVSADPAPLFQVFANLLRNASQAAGDGGALGVSGQFDGTTGEVVLTFWDDGPGVPPDLTEAIFGAFVTTKSDGAGLGLAIVHRIARSFGGTIALERQEDRTCFVLRLRESTERSVLSA